MKKTFFFTASGVLMLALGAAQSVSAGDGDVDYSAPYITVDPETGELVTVNPGPQLKMHSDSRSLSATQDPTNGQATMADAGTEAAAATGSTGETASGFPLLGFAALGAVALLFAMVFFFRGQGTTRDA
jgi:hypothetical protein